MNPIWNKLRGAVCVTALSIAALPAFMATGAQASLIISSAATAHVKCGSGVCIAMAKNAILNVKQLRTLLATSNVKVATGHATTDIEVSSALSWGSPKMLTLDALHSIIVDKPVTITGRGALALVTNDGGSAGTLSFSNKAHIQFWKTTNSLRINGAAYKLVNNITELATNIANNNQGHYALAYSYDASGDGIYLTPPVPTAFYGTFEGLGNTISNLSMNIQSNYSEAGLFIELDAVSGLTGAVLDIGLLDANVNGMKQVGALVGMNVGGTIRGAWATGFVSGGGVASSVGGLVGLNRGFISNSHASVAVNGTNAWAVGGLVGYNESEIAGSYATGAVTGGYNSYAGGLVGELAGGTILNSYATGKVTDSATRYDVGGLVGFTTGNVGISQAYSAGALSVTGANCANLACLGGMIGNDGSSGSFVSSYWDTTTSRVSNSSQGCGNVSNCEGVAGLTTTQLQSGRPSGFNPAVWGESANLNKGLPYLLANPPN